jgi:hypothetical protein
LIEAELTDLIGATPHERSAERSNLRVAAALALSRRRRAPFHLSTTSR